MNLVCLIVSRQPRAFQSWFIKFGSFAENIQAYKPIHLIQVSQYPPPEYDQESRKGSKEHLPLACFMLLFTFSRRQSQLAPQASFYLGQRRTWHPKSALPHLAYWA